jgi:hypothetical protein
MAEAASYRKLEHNADAGSEGEPEDVNWTRFASSQPRERICAWLRIGVEAALVLIIVALTAGLISPKADRRRGPNDPKRDCIASQRWNEMRLLIADQLDTWTESS